MTRLLYGVGERGMRQRERIAVEGAAGGTQPNSHVSATMGLLMVRSQLRAMKARAVGTSYPGREAVEEGQLTGTDDVGIAS